MEWTWIALGAAVWAAWAALANRVVRISLRGDVLTGLGLVFIRVYSRVLHGLRVSGAENIPPERNPGPLIVISNHTAGVDPILIQSMCPFEIRWLMAEDMRDPRAAGLWKWLGVIFVDRTLSRGKGVRKALRHLERGGVLGVFAEGRIERPPRRILPFLPGVGLLAAKSGAPILPFVVEGTPDVPAAWGSLHTPSPRPGVRVRVMPVIRWTDADRPPARDIPNELRRMYLEWTGWAAGDAQASGRGDRGAAAGVGAE